MQHEEKLFKVGKISLPGRRYTGAFIRPSGAQGYGDVIQDQQTAELFVVYVSGYDRPNPTFVEYAAVVRVCLDQSTAVCKLRRFRADLSKKPVASFIGDTVELFPEWEYLREQNPWTHSKAPKTWADLEKLSPVNPLNHEQSK